MLTKARVTAWQGGSLVRCQPNAHIKICFLPLMHCSFTGLCSNALCIQQLDLGPVLFSVFFNDLDDGTECVLRFADDTELGGVGDAPDGCAAIERDVNWLEIWANRDVVQFSDRECKAWHLGKNDPIHWHRLEKVYQQKTPWGSWWTQVGHEPPVCPCSKGGQQCHGLS